MRGRIKTLELSTFAWLENEIALAEAAELAAATMEGKPEDATYGIKCYDTARKAVNAVYESSPSGAAIPIISEIISRLLSGKPVTPLDDNDTSWEFAFEDKRGGKHYQHERYSGLYKEISFDGDVKYTDNNRVVCKNRGQDATFSNGLITRIIDEERPITMPYMPTSSPIIADTEEFTHYTTADKGYTCFGFYKYSVISGGKLETKTVNKFFRENDEGVFEEIPNWFYDSLRSHSHKAEIEEAKLEDENSNVSE